MNIPLKIAGFALGLVAVFGAAVGVGSATGSVGPAGATAPDPSHGMAGEEHAEDDGGAAAEVPAGLMVADGGYTLALDTDTLPASTAAPAKRCPSVTAPGTHANKAPGAASRLSWTTVRTSTPESPENSRTSSPSRRSCRRTRAPTRSRTCRS